MNKDNNSKNNTFFKSCTIDDIEILIKISSETFFQTFGPLNTEENMKVYMETAFTHEKIGNELKNPNSYFYILYSNTVDENSKVPVGYFKLNDLNAQGADNREDTSNSVELERIYLLNQFQGKGYGQVLFNKVLEISKSKKKSYIWLGVWEENKKAIEFYKKNGFKQFSEHVFIIGDDRQTDYLFKLDL